MSRRMQLRNDPEIKPITFLGQVVEAAAVAEIVHTDGRHARSERSRQAMVDALLDLLREGNVRPSSAQIAERAGVTQRTLFNQFGDMDSLVKAVAGRQIQRFLDLQPEAGDGSLEERATRYCDGLARLLEETMHVRWAILISPNPALSGSPMLRAALDFTRDQLAEAFAPELATLAITTQDEVLDALELVTDPAVWRLRRVVQELTIDESRRIVERLILGLLHDALRAVCAESATGGAVGGDAVAEPGPAPALALALADSAG